MKYKPELKLLEKGNLRFVWILIEKVKELVDSIKRNYSSHELL